MGSKKYITAYSEMFLPELDIQNGFSKFYGFFKRVVAVSRYYTFNFAFVSIITREDTRTDKPMGYTPEV